MEGLLRKSAASIVRAEILHSRHGGEMRFFLLNVYETTRLEMPDGFRVSTQHPHTGLYRLEDTKRIFICIIQFKLIFWVQSCLRLLNPSLLWQPYIDLYKYTGVSDEIFVSFSGYIAVVSTAVLRLQCRHLSISSPSPPVPSDKPRETFNIIDISIPFYRCIETPRLKCCLLSMFTIGLALLVTANFLSLPLEAWRLSRHYRRPPSGHFAADTTAHFIRCDVRCTTLWSCLAVCLPEWLTSYSKQC